MKQILNKKHIMYILCIIILSFELIGCGAKPTIITKPVTNIMVSEAYEYRVGAQGTPPIEFSAQKSPEGFLLDRNGLATWNPPKGGKYEVLIEAKNSIGKDQQKFFIKVDEKPIPKSYLKGVELGEMIWQKERFIYTLIKDLNEKSIEFAKDPDFNKGLLDGYKQGKLAKKSYMETDAEEIVNIVILAGLKKIDFESGKLVGEKLRSNEITVEQASREKRQLIIGGEARELAWKSGFIVGYTGNNYPEHSDYALRMYFGLPD